MANARNAVVTGANRGLGFATARALLERGYQVVGTFRAEADRERSQQELSAFGTIQFRSLELTQPASIQAFADWVRENLGHVDVLVNNAGMSMKGFNEEVARKTLAANFFGPLHLTQALLPLLASGANVVMVSSGMGELSGYAPQLRERFLDPKMTISELVELANEFITDVAKGRHEERGFPSSAYGVSKTALNALTRILARELTPLGAHVNAVCPGWVRTDMGGPHASRSVEQGAEGIVWAATLTSDGPTGGFFRDRKLIAW